MKKARVKLTLVGALPPPLGGVTVFLRRLTRVMQDDFDVTLLDLRKVEGKVPLFEGHLISPFSRRLMSLLWLQWRLLRNRPGVVHFHFSDVKGLMFAAFLLQRSRAVMLTLHHGVSKLSRKRRIVLKLLGPLIRRKIQVIHALNADQQAFYQSSIGFSTSSVFQCPTHINPSLGEETIGDETKALIENLSPYVLTSGVGDRKNRADLMLKYWEQRRADGTHLIVSIYGDSDPSYADELQRAADLLDTVTLIGPLPENDFNILLQQAALYVRPAEEDAFGIAVADALAFGTPVLASDACDRADGTHVFPRFDMVAMGQSLEQILANEGGATDQAPRTDRYEEYRGIFTTLAKDAHP